MGNNPAAGRGRVTDTLMLLHGNATPELARRIAGELGTTLGHMELGRYPDGEVHVVLQDDVRGRDVFVIQSTCPPVNENLMELLIIIDCVKRASAGRITAVIPYFGYARQDRRDRGAMVPISAKLIADLITAAGADRVLTMDLHAEQIQGFFDIPVDHIYAGPIFMEHFRQHPIPDLVIVSADVGSIKMARAYSKGLTARLATVDKRRINASETEVGFLIGDVDKRNALISDDVIATGGSIAQAAKILRQEGARDIKVAATHPVFCGPAIERLEASPISGIYVTDTIPIDAKYLEGRVHVLSCAKLLADAIEQIHQTASFPGYH